jgi:hypothetical protein
MTTNVQGNRRAADAPQVGAINRRVRLTVRLGLDVRLRADIEPVAGGHRTRLRL